MTDKEKIKEAVEILRKEFNSSMFSERYTEIKKAGLLVLALADDFLQGRIAEVASVEEIEKICFDHISLGTSEYYKMLPSNLAHALVGKIGQRGMGREDIEIICEKVHKAYCKYHLENKGTEYWTKGDYSKLTEEGKEYDRRTVRAVLDALLQAKG